MKKIYYLFLILHLSQIALGNEIFESPISKFDYTRISTTEVLESDEHLTVVKLTDENGIILYQVIAAVVTAYLPRTAGKICEGAGGKQELCDAVHDVTSKLISLNGKGIYKGVTQGLYWIATGGKKLSKAQIDVKTYGRVTTLKKIFEAYRNQREIPWDTIQFDEWNDVPYKQQVRYAENAEFRLLNTTARRTRRNREYGYEFKVKFNIKNMRGRPCRIQIYFMNQDNRMLIDDTNDERYESSSFIEARGDFIPNYENSTIELPIFIPQDQMHFDRNLMPPALFRYKIILRYGRFTISDKEIASFWIGEPSQSEYIFAEDENESVTTVIPWTKRDISNYAEANFTDFWVEHNVIRDGMKGMIVHGSIKVRNLKGEKCIVEARFYDKYGNELEDTNGKYRDEFGKVARGKYLRPRYNKSTYDDIGIFIPNKEIHLKNGEKTFKVKMQLIYSLYTIGKSNSKTFNFK